MSCKTLQDVLQEFFKNCIYFFKLEKALTSGGGVEGGERDLEPGALDGHVGHEPDEGDVGGVGEEVVVVLALLEQVGTDAGVELTLGQGVVRHQLLEDLNLQNSVYVIMQ